MITPGLCVLFKSELLQGTHDFTTDTFKIALYTNDADLDPKTTTVYTSTGEVTASGYSAGGVALTGATVTTDGAEAIVDFDNAVVPGTSMTFRGALIYNSSKSDRAVAILDMGKQAEPQTNPTIYMPTPFEGFAVIRL